MVVLGPCVLGGEFPAGWCVGGAEVNEFAQVEGCGSGGELLVVSVDAVVAGAAVAFGAEPGDGSFDHGSVLAVVFGADSGGPVGSGLAQVLVVRSNSGGSAFG